MMASGEHFLSENQKEKIKEEKKREQKVERKAAKITERNKTLEVPSEEQPRAPKGDGSKYENKKPSDIESLKKKFLKK